MAVSVKDYNNNFDSALSALAASGGGTLFVPNGIYLVDPLVLPDKVSIAGEGPASTLKLKPNSTGPVISLTPGAGLCQIRHLTIDGNKANQTNANAGINLNSPSLVCLVENVFITNTKGHGLLCGGASGSNLISNVEVLFSDGSGFVVNSDNALRNCNAGGCGLSGFVVTNPPNRLSNCKAWTCGQVDASQGYGFWIKTQSWAGAELVACEAQGNKRSGFFIDSCQNSYLMGCVALTNGLNSSYQGAGFELVGASNCRIDGGAYDGINGGQQPAQAYGLKFRTGPACTNNTISLKANGNTVAQLLDESSSSGSNTLSLS